MDVPGTWVKMMKESLFTVCQNFNINRVLCDYLNRYYLPSMQAYEKISHDDYQVLKTVAQEENDVLKYWDNIKIKSFLTDIEKREHLTKGEIVNAQCAVQLGQAPAELFSVELFYMLDGNSRFEIVPMQPQSHQNPTSHYQCSFEIEGYGLQGINVRIKPANEIVRDLHPELVKWAE